MLPFDSVLIVGAVAAGLVLALARAPRATLAALLAIGALAQSGTISASALPGAGQVSAIADSVSEWQEERIDAGACYFGTAERLNDGGPEALEPHPSCPAPAEAPATLGTLGAVQLP